MLNYHILHLITHFFGVHLIHNEEYLIYILLIQTFILSFDIIFLKSSTFVFKSLLFSINEEKNQIMVFAFFLI